MKDTPRRNEKFRNIFPSEVLFVIIVQCEFFPVNCLVEDKNKNCPVEDENNW